MIISSIKQKAPKQWLALGYGVIFFLIFIMNYVPGIHDGAGLMFGLFKLDTIDDLLHLGSSIWAFSAGWYSEAASQFYFRWFGLAYLLDGLIGIVVGKGYLDLAILLSNAPAPDMVDRIMLNIPHILLGGVAVLISIVLKNKNAKSA